MDDEGRSPPRRTTAWRGQCPGYAAGDRNTSDRHAQCHTGNFAVRTSSDVPFAEMALIRASQAALSQYKTGENDMQKGAARPMRAQAICSVLTSKQAQDWVGTVYTLDTNGEGKGVLSVLIAPDIYVATWNNALSDVSDGTLIDPRSNVFTVASQLRTGQKIRFSGQFFASETDCIEERSLTLGGSITEPEYVIKFGSVSALE
jgi:hypothetical protein